MAFAYDPMSDLARRKAQLKATGQPDMSIAELQAYGGGVMEAKSRAELSAQAQADRRNEVALNQSNIQEQAKAQKISGAASLGMGLLQLEVASQKPASYNMITGQYTPEQGGMFSRMYGAGKESIMGPSSEAAVGGTSAAGAGGMGAYGTATGGEAIGAYEAGGGGAFAAEGGAAAGSGSYLGPAGVGFAAGGLAGKYGPGGNKLPGTFGGERERAAESGAIKGGTAGAALGAAVGVWFFGIGAVPGAVIGGIFGAVGGALSASKEPKKK
jgi:hypothetical protein